MSAELLEKLFEHNTWANLQVIRACAALTDEQLDAEPRSVTKGSIRRTLVHLVSSQRGYLALLTLPLEARPQGSVDFSDLERSVIESGERLSALAGGKAGSFTNERLRTKEGSYVEPWVIVLQVINHATEHREQIKSMLTDLGIKPPDIDGWDYGEFTHTLVPIAE